MCGVSPGQPVEVGDRDACASLPSGCTVSTVASSARMATAMSLGCVAMHASLTPTTACCRLKPPIARAAAAGLALVARLVGVVEIRAARALQQIARRGRLVAQLARGAGEQRAREQRHSRGARARSAARSVLRTSAPMRSPPSGVGFDLVERQTVHVDQVRRRLDLELHQIEQVGAACDELGARCCVRRLRPLRRVFAPARR